MSALPTLARSEGGAAPRPARRAPASEAADARSTLSFITCGSVDDGKSTLIGRLLIEAGAVPEDALAALRADSARSGNAGDGLDYSLLVDGLRAEREQGITIDVAYRYFATARRSFVVADTPGHEQYTRNMATGASGAELAIILVDARKGVLPQTRRHALIASLVGVRHVVVAINKIDLVGHDEARIRAIGGEFRQAAAGLGFASIMVIPVSARDGDNVARRSPRTPWHEGPTLLGWLESIDVGAAEGRAGFAMPVQRVNRPDLDFRGFSGAVSAGSVRPGDAIVVLPSGERAGVARIATFDGDLDRADQGQAVTIVLDRELDISRGDVLVAASGPREGRPLATERLLARLLMTGGRPLRAGDSFALRIGTAEAAARVETILHGVDIESFANRDAGQLAVNDLGLVRLALDRPVAAAPYAASRDLGSFILIDRQSNATVAMGVVVTDAAPPGDGWPEAWRRRAEQALLRVLGPHRPADLAPAASWRIGSALLLGLIVGLATGSLPWGFAAALLDAGLRPLLRRGHSTLWAAARRQAVRREELMRDGGGI